jgi:hypothetical protein
MDEYAKSLEKTLGRVCELAYSLLPLIHNIPDELKGNYIELRDYLNEVKPADWTKR